MAAHLGAEVIEKHFTLDKNFSSFRDHKLSATPEEMKKLVYTIRNLELMLGKNKKIQKSESLNLAVSRRSIAANKNLKKNSIIKSSDLIFVRPRTKFCISNEKKIIGKN